MIAVLFVEHVCLNSRVLSLPRRVLMLHLTGLGVKVIRLYSLLIVGARSESLAAIYRAVPICILPYPVCTDLVIAFMAVNKSSGPRFVPKPAAFCHVYPLHTIIQSGCRHGSGNAIPRYAQRVERQIGPWLGSWILEPIDLTSIFAEAEPPYLYMVESLPSGIII